MSLEVAIVAGTGGALDHATAATIIGLHPANRAAFPAEVMTHAVAPEAIAGVSDAAALVCGAVPPAYGA